MKFSHQWVIYGGVWAGVNNKFFEYPIILTFLTITYFPDLLRNLQKHLLPLAPIFIFYISCDTFFYFLKRFPGPSDLENLSAVFAFSPLLALGIGFFLLLLPLSLLLLFWLGYNSGTAQKKQLALVVRLTGLAFVVILLSSNPFGEYMERHFAYRIAVPTKSIIKNGRIGSFLWFKHKESEFLHLLENHQKGGVNVETTLFPGKILMHRNIHLIVLESFIDPRLLPNISFNRTPLSKELNPFLLDNDSFSTVISPTYGGLSAQATFELLSGIKAYKKIGGVEYNVMKGYTTDSFVNRLKKSGYKALATIGSSSHFFNEPAAYRSLGFGDPRFLLDEGFRSKEGDRYIFDGELFEYNLKSIKSLLREGYSPFLNYVVGMYGHMPYDRNTLDRPTIIQTGEEGSILRIANQFYYRTKALGNYIRQLREIDPMSIIYITSDHLPPIIDDDMPYRFDRYTNISLLLVDGKKIDISGKKYYEIPWQLWDMLSKQHKRDIPESMMEEMYYTVLAKSISPSR